MTDAKKSKEEMNSRGIYLELYVPKNFSNVQFKRKKDTKHQIGEKDYSEAKLLKDLLARRLPDDVEHIRIDVSIYHYGEIERKFPTSYKGGFFDALPAYDHNPLYCRQTCKAVMGVPATDLPFLRGWDRSFSLAFKSVLELIGLDEEWLDYAFPNATVCSKRGPRPKIVPVYLLPYVFELCDQRITQINNCPGICRELERKMVNQLSVNSDKNNPDLVLTSHIDQLRANTDSLLNLAKYRNEELTFELNATLAHLKAVYERITDLENMVQILVDRDIERSRDIHQIRVALAEKREGDQADTGDRCKKRLIGCVVLDQENSQKKAKSDEMQTDNEIK